MPGAGTAHAWRTYVPPGAARSDYVIAARKLPCDVISETPVVHSRVRSEAVAGPVYLKCENLQPTGSFKVRGTSVKIARLSMPNGPVA